MSDTKPSTPDKRKRRVYNTKGTFRQKAAIKKLLDNPRKSVSGVMREVGYSDNTAVDPSNLTSSKTWEELMEQHFPDSKLSKVIDEGLEATRVISAVNTGKEANGATTDFVDVPDHAVRHKFTETALKLKKKFPSEKMQLLGENDGPIQIEITEALNTPDGQ